MSRSPHEVTFGQICYRAPFLPTKVTEIYGIYNKNEINPISVRERCGDYSMICSHGLQHGTGLNGEDRDHDLPSLFYIL